jgi:UDP-N-acetylmuramoyl-L-alanyl-D-glutamate--2,6-diaminopimelate ligase
MLLRELAAESGGRLIGDGDIDVGAVEYDSRAVRPGALFVAVPGLNVDGHAYLGRALENGAQAVAVEAGREAIWRAVREEGGADILVLDDTRAGLARLAAALHGHPARSLKVVGVTGTDGKTSLCHLVAHVLNATARRAGLISTAECRIGENLLPDTGRFTTPESPQVQSMLAEMRDAGCEWAVIEATSHGLALHRVDECDYDIAVLTNIGADHLDFHGSPEDYMAAKARLFELMAVSAGKGIEKTAVLPADDAAFGYYDAVVRGRKITFGIGRAADVDARDLRPQGWGVRFQVVTPRGTAEAFIPRPGEFMVRNALAATAVALAASIPLEEVVPALASWPGAPGRLERLDRGQPFSVIVDFAHAPDSLRRVLRLLKDNTRGRVIAVFGCIGEHDRARRPGMARVAAELADYTLITDDNPYSEDRDGILNEISSAMRDAGKREGHDFSVVPDRREAIAQAVSMAVDEDVVLLAGKGHEREVNVGNESYPCDDREVARQVLEKLGY